MTQICHANGNQAPTDVHPIPGALRNMANPTLQDMVADGWREYVPSVLPNIKSSEWVDTGTMCVQSNVVQYTAEELAAQDAARRAEIAASDAAWLAYQAEIDHAERITKGLALTILDELNQITQRMRAFDAAVQAATSLADMKARVAALSAVPDRTVQHLKAAVKTKVEGLP
jgi:hypothetical protein